MSDVEKNEVSEIVSVVKASVAEVAETKAEKADLEAVKESIPSVEGFVKAEVVEALVADMAAEKAAREELEAVVKSAPAMITKEAAPVEDLQFNNYEGIKGEATVDFTKAFTGTGSSAQVTGSMTDMQRLYHVMQQKNPYRSLATIMPTSAGSVNLPQVTAITAAVEATLSTLPASPGGNIASVNVIPQNWVSRSQFTDQSVEDLPGLDQMVASFMAQAIARSEAADMVAQLDGASISEVNTGAAAGNPTAISVWADLVAELDSAYRDGAAFVMSRAAYASLRSLSQSGTGSDLVIDPKTGMQSLWSYPIFINDHHADGTSAGDNSVYFGDFKAGAVIVSRKEMNISRHEDTLPGAMYYYGNMRSRGVAWDTSALVRLNTAA